MLAELPDWLDTEFLRGLSAGLIVAAAVLLVIVVIWAKSLAVRILVGALVVAGAFGLFRYREELEDCAPECDCSFMGEDLPADACNEILNPASAPS
jgi:hypothetical protein